MVSFFALQAQAHPALQPADALKMAYQAAFGAEHLLTDQQKARAFLHAEMTSCRDVPGLPVWERIGDDTLRIHLAPWRAAGLPEEWLARLFIRSCRPRPDGEERFYALLRELDALTAAGRMPFAQDLWQREKKRYLEQGIRPVHHSESYRSAEKPAYRVADGRYAPLLTRLTACGGRGVIALDGRCASGKSTLAQEMADIADAAVVHMDDFFLPPDLRTEKRLGEPGGNIHYERFLTDVLPYLGKGQAFSYPVFDCSRMRMGESRQVACSALTVAEGAYSCHPALGSYMTLRAFSDIDAKLQKQRILERNGKAGWENFRTRWIPMEEEYFAAYRIREQASVILQARSG